MAADALHIVDCRIRGLLLAAVALMEALSTWRETRR
jgi:hypothetical protein